MSKPKRRLCLKCASKKGLHPQKENPVYRKSFCSDCMTYLSIMNEEDYEDERQGRFTEELFQ